MSRKVIWKVCITLAVISAAVAIVFLKPASGSNSTSQPAVELPKLPRLVDLGAHKCIPCKMMAPVLDELRNEYAGVLVVDFYDVWQEPAYKEQYKVKLIPTQIFYDATGKELFRHEGFMSKEDILKKWLEHGIDLDKAKAAITPTTQPKVFYDAAGKEVFRPEGLMSSEDPLKKWLEPGLDPTKVKVAVPTSQPAKPEVQAPAVQKSWLEEIFESLTTAVSGAPLVAIFAAFVWGILSIVLSPCHLASIPLIVGFIDEQGKITTGRAFCISSLFSVGILLTIALIGAITALAGRMMGDVGAYGNYLVAVIFFLVGLHLLDVFPMPFSGPGQVGMKRRGMLAAFILGLVFGVALGPCTFAYLAPMLGVTFKMSGQNLAYGVLLLLIYGLGHCSVIVLAGTSTELVQKYLNWNGGSVGAKILKRCCGLLVVVGGLYLLYTAQNIM